MPTLPSSHRPWAPWALLLASACSVGGGPTDAAPASDSAMDASTGVECVTDVDCSDRIACTVDHCEAGVCVQDACTDCCPSPLSCVVGVGCVAIELCSDDSECNDGVPCTLDRCRDAEVCEHRAQNELCPSGEACFPALGCIPAPPESCVTGEDCTGGNACLGTWSCQPEFGCSFLSAPDCDDDDACTVDSCDSEMGACVHAPRDADSDGHAALACAGDDCDDGDDAVHPGASERCNGIDDDCDASVDETCCTAGDACTTSCGTTGATTCNSDGTAGPCMPPAETCNGADDDCDGARDEDFECERSTSRACTTGCSSAGTQACQSDCTWAACAAGVEMCGGGDDDCDSRVDEGFACSPGASGSCTTSCSSTGSRDCQGDCSWDTCRPPSEICNGVDDDCDTVCDDGFTCCAGATRGCSTLGFFAGTATCRSDCGGWDTTGCTNCGNGARNAPEDCDGSDLGTATCATVPGSFGSGTLRCTAGCTFDTTSCSLCRNGVLDTGEQCDGSALGGVTCATLPGGAYTGGALACNTACAFDTSGCVRWDPSGTYPASPHPAYQCAYSTLFMAYGVDYDIASFVFSDAGSGLTITGGPCTMTGSSIDPSTRFFSACCTIPSGGFGCSERYCLSGTYSSDDSWSGMFSRQYTADFVGACSDCTNGSVSTSGTR